MVTRLTGGVTPASSGNPRTYPAIHNEVVDELERLGQETDRLELESEKSVYKGQPNGYPGLDASGKIATAALPPLAITEPYPVANEAEMLALGAQAGDVAIRTDIGQSFILAREGDPTVLSDWLLLHVPEDAPVDSVNGQVGTVLLTAADVAAEPSGAVQGHETEHDHTSYLTQHRVPDPTQEPDGRWLKVQGGGYVFTDAPAGGGGAFTQDDANTLILPSELGYGWVIGSDRFDKDVDDTTKDNRAFFNKTKGAFRAGTTDGSLWNVNADAWDDANVGLYSHAEGGGTIASGDYSHAEGRGTEAASISHAEGDSTKAISAYSHAEGYNTQAINGSAAHAEGWGSIASAARAHAEGMGTLASGSNSHAEGNDTIASGVESHAEGRISEATEKHSHAEGYLSRTHRYAEHAKASGTFGGSGAGSAQIGNMVIRGVTTDATPQSLTADGATAIPRITPNVLTLNENHWAIKFRLEVVARQVGGNDTAGFTVSGMVTRDVGQDTLRLVGVPAVEKWGDTGAQAWQLDVNPVPVSSYSNGYLDIVATGEAGKTIRWVAGVYYTELRVI